ncbi:hypothetical protein WSS_A43955 [Rhodococcus opacus M213]|uniref:Uncharacterized protein n=1 Tax=Rhodococcus opacus M213 TaxID=1129896 RepID=K8XCZ1_RHOOP|nr:hypothetical protein WSS_A43955 [Rhodococcus opacus M213]
MCLVCLGAMWEKTAFEFAFVGLGFQRSFLSEAEIKKGDGKIFGIDEDIVGFNIFMDDFGFVDLGEDLQQAQSKCQNRGERGFFFIDKLIY